MISESSIVGEKVTYVKEIRLLLEQRPRELPKLLRCNFNHSKSSLVTEGRARMPWLDLVPEDGLPRGSLVSHPSFFCAGMYTAYLHLASVLALEDWYDIVVVLLEELRRELQYVPS